MKAQVIFEYITVFMLLLVIGVAFSLHVSNLSFFASKQARSLEFQRIADRTAGEINTAFLAGDGYSRSFSIPQTVYGDDYNVSLDPPVQLVFVEKGGAAVAQASLISSNVSGSVKRGNNTLVSKNGGVQIS